MKNRIISFVLTLLILSSTIIGIFPSLEISAATAPSVSVTVSKSTITLGDSITYTAVAKGNSYKLNTVTLSISYYKTEEDYDDGAVVNYVYIRNTGLSTSQKTIEGTFKTSSGSYVSGTENDGSGSRKLYTDEAGIYNITLTAYSSDYGTYVKKSKKIVVEKEEPSAKISVSNSELELGEKITYTATAYGNDYKLNTVTLSISYYQTEENYDKGAALNYVYIRHTGLSTSQKTIDGTFNTSPGSYITGTENDGSGSRRLYTDKAGIYTITITAYSNEYGDYIMKTRVIDVLEPEKEEPDVSISTSKTEIDQGESLTYSGTAYGNDYLLDTVTIGFTYYPTESDYTAGLAYNYIYQRSTGLSTYQKIIEGTFKTSPGSYVIGTENDGSGSRKLYTDKPGIYTITISAYSSSYGDYIKATKKITVNELDPPEVNSITTSANSVSVGESFVITVTTTPEAYGVVLYADNLDWCIGEANTQSSTNTYTFTYQFEKTNKIDSNGNDITNVRKIIAYPIDINGNIVYSAESMDDYSITVNPATYNFSDFEVYDTTARTGASATITWENVQSKNGAKVYYNVWIGDECFITDLITNSYTLTAEQIDTLGSGTFAIMVFATANGYRQKQSVGELTITTNTILDDILPGDVNGDGLINGIDATRLRKYLANTDVQQIPSNGTVTIGADVNKDGLINGKDLTMLLNMLLSDNQAIPSEPAPEISIPTQSNHTYTINIPLDKAELTATNNKTIYLMPKYGYVGLVAYDETGSQVRLNKAGFVIDTSKCNGIVSFDGYTLKAVKCGYGIITYSYMLNGKTVTEEIAIHVGEASVTPSAWPTSYRYNNDDYEYFSMIIDLAFSLHKAQSPTQYVDVWLNDFDMVVDSINSLSDYFGWIFQRKYDFDVQTIKKSLADFIKDYASEIYSSSDVHNDSVNKAQGMFGIIDKLYDLGLSTCSTIKGGTELYNIVYKIKQNGANWERIKELAEQLSEMKKNGGLKDLYSKIEYATKLSSYDELLDSVVNFEVFTKMSSCDKLASNLNWTSVATFGFDVVESIFYMAYDYAGDIKVLEKMRSELLLYYDASDVEINAINQLISEYENKYIESLINLGSDILIQGVDMLSSNPILSIVKFAAIVSEECRDISERKDCITLEFYTSAIYKSIDCATDAFTTGKQNKTIDELKFFTSLYLNIILRQNELALKVTKGTSDEDLVEDKINLIKDLFNEYLHYEPAASN